jgi:hypothetical protein
MRRIVSEVKNSFTIAFSVFQNLEKPTWLSNKKKKIFGWVFPLLGNFANIRKSIFFKLKYVSVCDIQHIFWIIAENFLFDFWKIRRNLGEKFGRASGIRFIQKKCDNFVLYIFKRLIKICYTILDKLFLKKCRKQIFHRKWIICRKIFSEFYA